MGLGASVELKEKHQDLMQSCAQQRGILHCRVFQLGSFHLLGSGFWRNYPLCYSKDSPTECTPATIYCLQLAKKLICIFHWKRDSLSLAVLEWKIILMPHMLCETQDLSTDSSHKLSTWPQPKMPPSLCCCSGKVNKKETSKSDLLHLLHFSLLLKER